MPGMSLRVHALYWSPTGTTKRVVSRVADALSAEPGFSRGDTVDCTLTAIRAGATAPAATALGGGELLVVGCPVYAGRVPNLLLPFLSSLRGGGALAVPMVVYGNRGYDDALVELADTLASGGFTVAGAGAFVGEHAFSRLLAAGRPDAADLRAADDFARALAARLGPSSPAAGGIDLSSLPGNRPYRPHYRPRDAAGEPVDLRKVVPLASGACTRCGLCARLCPMGSIDAVDPSRLTGVCVKCGACEKACPVGARRFVDERYLRHALELERDCAARREPAYFA